MTSRPVIYITRSFSMLLAIYMLNMSVDMADHEGGYDVSVNEIESIVELVYEVVLDHPNIIPEHEEPDPELAFMMTNLFCSSSIQFLIKCPYRIHEVKQIAAAMPYYLEPTLGTPSPPPDTIC